MSGVDNLSSAVAGAWRTFECTPSPPRVSASIPILFFGDLKTYCSCKLQVVTAGLNPSLQEFPKYSPFTRFPLAEGVTAGEPERYLDALCAYFRTEPYRSWFGSFEPMLNGLGSSYYKEYPSTALHTDVCSPVATNPTWSRLDEETRQCLESDGGPLWHTLVKVLKPDLVVLSIAQSHLARIEFEALSEWKNIHTFDKSNDGKAWKRSIGIWVRYYRVCYTPTMFVFIRAAQSPLAWLSKAQRQKAGGMALRVWQRCGYH